MERPVTQSHNTFAAIYCRISSDKTGAGLGVERQEADCRELANRLGLEVKHVLVDNDISAYSGKKRPGYEELLRLIESREIGYVVAWHTDRLHRRLRDLLDYCDAVEKASTKTVTVKAGDIDLSTAMGIAQAQMGAVFAENYVRSAKEKLLRKKLELAQNGKFLGGQRPYGFEPRREGIREKEAAVLREMAQMIIDGSSYRTVAFEMNHRGIRTQHGKKWAAINVRNVLIRPINAGIVDHHGVQYKAKTPAIFTPEEWAALQAAIRINRSKSNHPGRFRKHMLNGLLFCGNCGAKMFHKSKQQRDGTYKTAAACGKTHSQTGEWHGCGKVSRRVEPIIDLVTDALIYRLDSPELAQQIQRQQTNSTELADLLSKQSALNARIAQLSDDFYVRGLLDRDEFERVKLSANAELKAIDEAIEKSTRSTMLPSISLSGDIRAAWETASLEWKRDLLFQVIERIEVMPKPKIKGYYPPRYKDQFWFDPELIKIRWRV